MPVTFGTKEWLDAFMNRLNTDEIWKQAAASYEGRIIFKCLADPGIHEMLKEDLRFYFDPYHGRIREWRILEPGEKQEAEYEIYGKYNDWKLVATGKLELKRAVIQTRQINITGKVSELLRNMKAANRIINVLAEMKNEFVFPDEAAA